MVSYKKILKFFDSSRTATISPAPRRVHGCHLWRRFRAQAAIAGRPSAVGCEGSRRCRDERLGGCRDSNGIVEAVDSNRDGPSGLHLFNQDRGSVGSGNASSQPGSSVRSRPSPCTAGGAESKKDPDQDDGTVAAQDDLLPRCALAYRGACPTRKKLPKCARSLDDNPQGVRTSFRRMSPAPA